MSPGSHRWLSQNFKERKKKERATVCPNAVRSGSPDVTDCMQVENARQEDSGWPKPSRWLQIVKLETAVENHLR